MPQRTGAENWMGKGLRAQSAIRTQGSGHTKYYLTMIPNPFRLILGIF